MSTEAGARRRTHLRDLAFGAGQSRLRRGSRPAGARGQTLRVRELHTRLHRAAKSHQRRL